MADPVWVKGSVPGADRGWGPVAKEAKVEAVDREWDPVVKGAKAEAVDREWDPVVKEAKGKAADREWGLVDKGRVNNTGMVPAMVAARGKDAGTDPATVGGKARATPVAEGVAAGEAGAKRACVMVTQRDGVPRASCPCIGETPVAPGCAVFSMARLELRWQHRRGPHYN